MEAKESLQRRYLQALAAMMDEDAPDRRWIPVVSFGSASETVVDAAYQAAHRVDRDVIILELFADDREVVQHRIRAAYRAGKVRQYVSDGMLWIPNAAGRAVIVPRTGSSRFRIAVDAKGGLRRHVGLPTADLTFGAALAAKRLREIAGSTMPDALMPALKVEGR